MKFSKIFPVVCALVLAQHAYADTCDNVAVGTPIYFGGSSALGPLVAVVGPKLASQQFVGQSEPYSLFYYSGGSCNGVNNILGTFDLTAATVAYYSNNPDGGILSIPDGGTAVAKSCTIPAAQSGLLDVGLSDVFAATCIGGPLDGGFADTKGPAQAMVFVTHPASTQTAITAEDAYIALGFGGVTNLAPPWTQVPGAGAGNGTPTGGTTPGALHIRSDSSGTKRILATAAGLNWTKWLGVVEGGSGAVFTAIKDMQGTTAQESSLGILGLDYLDVGTRRSQVKELALAAYGQKYAFFPDSSTSSFDKKNLREGRYAGLGYAHFISSTTTITPKAQYLIDLLTGNQVDVVKTVSKDAHLVPLCAMKVALTAEGGDIQSYTPAQSCACFFESQFNGAPPGCQTCTTTCSTGVCRNGWCEAR
jgi:hypothetical protein